MKSNLVESLTGITGVSTVEIFPIDPAEIKPEEASISMSRSRGFFVYNELKCTFKQFVSPSITMNMFNVAFTFNTMKKQQKIKILECLNSYNSSKPAIKTVLRQNLDNSFVVDFSMEFMLSDEQITVKTLTPIINVLAASPALLVQAFGSFGIVITTKKKNG